MPSLFGGLQRQAAALPPIVPQAAPARRGLIGGGRPQADPNAIGLMERIAMAGQALGGGGTFQSLRRAREGEIAAQGLAEQQRAQREQYAASIQDPRERQLFLTAPDQWAANIGKQYAPETLAAGSAQVVNGQRTVEQPSFSESGDSILSRTSEGVAPVFTRTTPSISEQTAQQNADTSRFSAQSGAQVAQGQLGVAQGRLGLDQQNSGFTLGQNQTRFNPDGSPVAALTAAADPAIQARQAEARTAMAQNLRTGLTGARRYLDAAGVLAPYLPWEMQDRADLAAQLDTLKGNITFEKLTEMKANSPNGASGLGALSDNEARMLASTVAALDPSMSQEELQRSFTVIDNLVKKLEEGSTAPAAAQGQAPDRAALLAEARRRGLIQ